uniref:sensor histidine kinase n=1 Tax=Leyella stercorea TaxID=363265 RepID=UPI003FD6CB82
MTPEELQSVFNAFTRLPGAQGKEGVDLGLTITREIVTLLGGRINVASTKGKGTTFRVCLPVKVVANQGIHSGGALVSTAPRQQPGGAPTKQQYSQSEEKNILVGALETSASPEETTTPSGETTTPPEETTAPPNEQERERLTKQLIEKLKEILCDIY